MKERLHRHHIVPKHAGGTNDESNLTAPITVGQHAEEHRKLWEQHGRYQDFLAWKALSGFIGKEVVLELARLHRLKEVICKPVEICGVRYPSMIEAQIAMGKTWKCLARAIKEGRDPSIRANAEPIHINGVFYKSQREAERILGISRAKIGRGNFEGDKRKEQIECPHCGKVGDLLNMNRWHMNNCKQRVDI